MAKNRKKAGRVASKGGDNSEDQATLAGLATEIRAGHKLCLDALKGVVAQAKAIGDSLNQAKKLVKPGRWLAWVEDNCQFAVRMAQNYMLVADHYKAIVAQFETADSWTLIEFIKVARKLKARKRGKGATPSHVKPGPFHLDSDDIARRCRKFEGKTARPEIDRVGAAPAVKEFVRRKLDAIYAAVRKFARSKDIAAVADGTLDFLDLGVVLVQAFQQAIDPAGLFIPVPAPAVPIEPSADKVKNRIKSHLGNGKEHGSIAV